MASIHKIKAVEAFWACSSALSALSALAALAAYTVIYNVYKSSVNDEPVNDEPVNDEPVNDEPVNDTVNDEPVNDTVNDEPVNEPVEKCDNKQSVGNSMVIRNSEDFYTDILQYIYEKYPSEIDNFNYSVEDIPHFNEFRYRRSEKSEKYRVFQPENCKIEVLYKGHNLTIDFEDVVDGNNNHMKLLLLPPGVRCGNPTEELCRKVTLRCRDVELLTEFADEARAWNKLKVKRITASSKDTMNVYYYKKDFWQLLAKSPKRPLSTVYLKEGIKDDLLTSVNDFFSHETRDIYLSFGIPYKSVNLIHGPPGTGKTSLIKAIASDLDCDLYILPISKDMLDTNLVDAFSFIIENEGKERIIVIEDIDTMFDGARKADDDKNGITLQAFLNCLDGFTCVEGTMLFLTANRPEVLDFAMIRSCRIDNKIKLDNADEYQTHKMFMTFLPHQSGNYKEFYQEIRYRDYSTAMLQEFLFYNRDCENIVDIVDKFIGIIDANDPKSFEILKEENKNFYS